MVASASCNSRSNSAAPKPPLILPTECFGLTTAGTRSSSFIRTRVAHRTVRSSFRTSPFGLSGPRKWIEGLFDSDLSYQDAIENVYGWKEQAIVGSEAINGVTCQVLESKPGNSSVSMYAKARSWIDPRRLVPLRIEKYSHSGELIRRIEITRIARDEKHNPIPAGLTVHGLRKNTVTEFNGARIDQGVTFTDDDFKPASVLH